MEHRVLHMSVHCRARMHESTRKSKLCCQLCCQLCCTDYIFIIRFYSSHICHLKYLKTTTGRTLRLHLKIDFETDLSSNITRHSCSMSAELVVSSFITHTHPFNGHFSGTTQVSRYQKGKTNLDFTEARDSEWQWHQLGHMQVCTSLQTDNHASTSPLSFFTGRMPFLPPNQQRQSTEVSSIIEINCLLDVF